MGLRRFVVEEGAPDPPRRQGRPTGFGSVRRRGRGPLRAFLKRKSSKSKTTSCLHVCRPSRWGSEWKDEEVWQSVSSLYSLPRSGPLLSPLDRDPGCVRSVGPSSTPCVFPGSRRWSHGSDLGPSYLGPFRRHRPKSPVGPRPTEGRGWEWTRPDS